MTTKPSDLDALFAYLVEDFPAKYPITPGYKSFETLMRYEIRYYILDAAEAGYIECTKINNIEYENQKAEIAELRLALEYYAAFENWDYSDDNGHGDRISTDDLSSHEGSEYGGKTARQALEQKGGK